MQRRHPRQIENKLNRYLLSSIALLTFSGPLNASASAPECAKAEAQGVTYKYCVQKSGIPNSDVLLYLHGSGGSEEQWFLPGGFADQFAKSFRAAGRSAPSIITFSFGPSWLIGDVPTPRHPAFLPIVDRDILPMLEQKVERGLGRLFVMGPSMGGFNSAILALRLPGLFAKAMPLCPGMLPLPFEPSKNEVDTYLKENSSNISRKALEGILAWVKSDFQTANVWARHNPLELSQKVTPAHTEFYVSSTFDDDYGFFAGAKAFAANLKTRGLKVETSFDREGRHCEETDVNVSAMTAFLLR